jgi:hypothetical protein
MGRVLTHSSTVAATALALILGALCAGCGGDESKDCVPKGGRCASSSQCCDDSKGSCTDCSGGICYCKY